VLVIDYDGHGPRQITSDNSSAFAPSWSPVDGVIAYASFKRGKADLYAVDSESGKGYDISRHPGINSSGLVAGSNFIAATLSMKDGNQTSSHPAEQRDRGPAR
jgi:Tol biopolymer transport system component